MYVPVSILYRGPHCMCHTLGTAATACGAGCRRSTRRTNNRAMGGNTRVSAPPEWAPPPPNDPDSSIDPVYMIQQINALHEANRPATAQGPDAERTTSSVDDDEEGGGVESTPAVVAAKRLWDLAAGEARAAFLVQHQLHDVTLLILAQHERHAARLCELCMGCLANLASVPEVAPMLLAAEDEIATVVLRVWMTCPDALVLSETSRLHLAFTSCGTTRDAWLRHMTADEPLNQLVCLAMSAKEPLLLARLCAVLQQVLREMAVAYHLVAKCHFAAILTHLLETEVPESFSGPRNRSSHDHSDACSDGTRGTKRSFDQTGVSSGTVPAQHEQEVQKPHQQHQKHDTAKEEENYRDELEGGGLREGALSQTPWGRGSARAFGAQTATLADQAVDSGGLQSALFFQLHAAEVLAYYSQEAVVSAPETQSDSSPQGATTLAGVPCCPARELAQQDGLKRVVMAVIRRTRGKGGLCRPALATLDYLLELPMQGGGWQLQTLPEAVPTFMALCTGIAAAVGAIRASTEQSSSDLSGGGASLNAGNNLLVLSTEEELAEFRTMVTLGWSVLVKLVDASTLHLKQADDAGGGKDDVAAAATASSSEGLLHFSTSDLLTKTLTEIVKADLVRNDEALPTMQRLAKLRESSAAVLASGTWGDPSLTVTSVLLETLENIGASAATGEGLGSRVEH